MKKVKGGITAPQGFRAGGIAAGIKQSGKSDLALIVSDVPATATAVFTNNQFKAAPILVSQQQIKSGLCQAIIANAGNANCGTGARGMKDAWQMVKATAKSLNINPKHVLVTSTGSIHKFLPIDRIVTAIPKLAQQISKQGGEAAARSILTTDTRKKEIAVKVGGYTIAGIAKGSGMIHPNMATMHAFITTDAAVDRRTLQKMLKQAVDASFNMLTVDQCMSTNDCVFMLANGESGARVQGPGASKKFYKALEYVCKYLAQEIARDGEGATQMIRVKVTGARNEAEARLAARAIAGSDLLKCAVYGRDHNPGRVLAAAGSTGAKLNQAKMTADMKFPPKGKKKDKETLVTCYLGVGKGSAEAWGCDLTEGYIRINADYHT